MEAWKRNLGKRQWFYAWHRRDTGEMVGWVFKSSVAAKKWRDETYWRYPKHPTIDSFFRSIQNQGQKKFSSRFWIRDRDMYEQMELRKGVLDYIELDATGRDKNRKKRSEYKRKLREGNE